MNNTDSNESVIQNSATGQQAVKPRLKATKQYASDLENRCMHIKSQTT